MYVGGSSGTLRLSGVDGGRVKCGEGACGGWRAAKGDMAALLKCNKGDGVQEAADDYNKGSRRGGGNQGGRIGGGLEKAKCGDG